MDLKTGDKVNIMIAFYDDNGMITKENCFFKKNIEITEFHDIPGVFYSEKIKDIKPKNFSNFIPKTGYEFTYSIKTDYIVQFNTSYNAMILISKESYFDIKETFFNTLMNECNTNIEQLKTAINKEKKQYQLFQEIKG